MWHQSASPTRIPIKHPYPPSLFCIYLPNLHIASLSTSQQSIIHNKSSFLTNNFNLTSLLTSTIPTCIYLPYLNTNLTSLITTIMPTHYTKPLEPIITPTITPIAITPIHHHTRPPHPHHPTTTTSPHPTTPHHTQPHLHHPNRHKCYNKHDSLSSS